MASNKKLYKDAVSILGHGPQLDVAVREASSLIGEIQKYKLMRDHNVQLAVADMEIMLQQLKLIFPGANDVKKERLLRLQEMLNQRNR